MSLYKWPDGTPRSQCNAFNWRTQPSQIAAQLQREKTTSLISSQLVESKKITTLTYSKASKK